MTEAVPSPLSRGRRRLRRAWSAVAARRPSATAPVRIAQRRGPVMRCRDGSIGRCAGFSSRSSRTIPGQFDPAFWLDYFKQIRRMPRASVPAGSSPTTRPTCRCTIAARGWETVIPSVTLVSGCRALGMQVIARTDPHAAREEVRVAHPDWIAVTKDGQPYRHWANPELWVTCALGPYNFEFMDRGAARDRHALQGRRDLCQPLGGAGGLLLRALPGNFRKATGLDLPRGTDARDPVRRQFIQWRKARLTELWKHFDVGIRAINPDACFIPNGPPDLKTAGELAHIQFTDNQARRGMTPPWSNGHRAKELRSVMGRRPIGGIFSVGLEEPYRWKDSVQSEPEIRLWVAEGTANGMRPWVTKFSGVLYDRRWMPMVDRIYQWHARHERYLRNEMPLARVALLHSEQTSTFHPGVAAGDRAGDHVLGMYHALIEARVPFEVVHEAFLTPDRLDRVQAADPGGRGRVVRGAVRGDSRVCRSRRQRAGDLCVVALRRARRSAARTSVCPSCSACPSAEASTDRCRTRT